MEAVNRAGRVVGAILLVQMVGGAMLNFVLEAPLFDAPGFLLNAASYPRQLGLAVLLGVLLEALWVAIAIAMFPLLWPRARSVALWLVVLAAVVLAAAVVEGIGVMSMVSVSQAHARASAGEREVLQAVRVVVASGRNWAHFSARLLDGVTILVFYCALFRFALVPRALAGFGVVAAVLMLGSIALPFFGRDVVFPLLAPLGLSQLIVAAWLLAKGFRRTPPPGGRQAGGGSPQPVGAKGLSPVQVTKTRPNPVAPAVSTITITPCGTKRCDRIGFVCASPVPSSGPPGTGGNWVCFA